MSQKSKMRLVDLTEPSFQVVCEPGSERVETSNGNSPEKRKKQVEESIYLNRV